MHIKRFRCAHLPPLGSLELGCNERVNLLIGPNSCGKSTILRAINELYSSKESYTPSPPLAPSAHMEASDEWPRSDDPDPYSAMWGLVPLLYIPATRIHVLSRHVFNRHRRRYPTPDTQNETYLEWTSGSSPIMESVDGPYVEPAIFEALEKEQLEIALSLGYSCAREVCSEIIRDNTPTVFQKEFDPADPSGLRAFDDYLGGGPRPFRMAMVIGRRRYWVNPCLLEDVECGHTRHPSLDMGIGTKGGNCTTNGSIWLGEQARHPPHRRNRESSAPYLAAPCHSRPAEVLPRPADICDHTLAVRCGRPEDRAGAPC